MRPVSNRLQTMRKFLWVGLPIAHSTKPAGIEMKHLQPQRCGIPNHMIRNLLVYHHPATPTVVHSQRVVGVLPCLLIGKHFSNPAPKHIRSRVRPASVGSEKNSRRFKYFARLQPSAELTQVRIEPNFSAQRIALADQSQMSASAELYSDIPSGLDSEGMLDQ